MRSTRPTPKPAATVSNASGWGTTATIRQDNNSSANLTYWAERSITLVRDGEEEELTFQRRAGARGYLAGPGARTASKSAKSAATEPPVPESTDEPTEETVEVELPTAIL